MTQNFENLFDLCKFLKNYASILGNLTELSNGKASKQQKLLEQIRQSTNQNQTADEAFPKTFLIWLMTPPKHF